MPRGSPLLSFSKIKPKVSEKCIKLSLGCIVFLIALEMLGPLLLALFLLAFLATRELVLRKVAQIHQVGLVNYLPEGLKIALLDRSIFDYLCDFWYVPSLSKILKAVIKPMFLKTEALEAEKNLHELDENMQIMIKTKGIVNILPPILQRILLPEGDLLSFSRSVSANRGEERIISTFEGTLPDTIPMSHSNELEASKPDSFAIISRNKSPEGSPIVFARTLPGSSGMPRMKIISTNKTIRKEKNKKNRIITSKWDKLEQFVLQERQKLSKSTEGV